MWKGFEMEQCRLLGMALVLCASAWTGFQAAAGVRRTYRRLYQLRLSLERMRCEIACRLTPLRKLTGLLADSCSGELSRFYRLLGERLHRGEDIPEAARAAANSGSRPWTPFRSALQ